MKKTLIFTLVSLTLSVSAHAMTVSQEWDKTYDIGLWQIGLSGQQTHDGGYIAGGFTANAPQLNFMLLKLDSNGNTLWQKIYGGQVAAAFGGNVQQTMDGGYIVASKTGYAPEPTDDHSILVLKLDVDGNISWQKTYWDNYPNVDLVSITQIQDGGYIITTNGCRVMKIDGAGNIIWNKLFSPCVSISPTEYRHKVIEATDGNFVMVSVTDQKGLVVKFNNTGDIMWQKSYEGIAEGGCEFFSIVESSEGGYVVVGITPSIDFGYGFGVLHLDVNGNILWQKHYASSRARYATSIDKTADGGYIVAGGSTLLLLKITSTGDISWGRRYGDEYTLSGYFPEVKQTTDGGYIVTTSDNTNDLDMWVLKLDENGLIGNCDAISTPDIVVSDTLITAQDADLTISSISSTVTDVNLPVQEISAVVSTICQYDNPNDIDGDGIENIPGGTMASGMFLAEEDNCPYTPNGPYLGTCLQGVTLGMPCISDNACGYGGVCSMSQEDSFPPGGNGIGDTCDCECDFDCNGNVDATDVTTFLIDFGRSQHYEPCTNQTPCSGDVDCNGAVDADDVINFVADFGRSQHNNPCPACVEGNWCVYP